MNVEPGMPDGMFCGTGPHDMAHLEISDSLNAGCDLLQDAGMLDQERVRLLIAADRATTGPYAGDPEGLARKLVRLNSALR